MERLESFDVFDTVLTRLIGQPSSLFILLGHRLARDGNWPHSAEQFAAARVTAESQARQHSNPRDVTLREIYQQLVFSRGLSPQTADVYSTLEIQLESELIRVVPAARDAIDAARAAKSQIAFISDTYLPSEVIRHWLTQQGLATQKDAVWVSSEYGLTKASGELFRLIRRESSVPPVWRHVGDHPQSDLAVPRALGIEARLWNACQLTRYERLMESHTGNTAGLSSLLAGAARWLRISHPAATEMQAGLRDIAAGVAGPVLWAFVSWVLMAAQREGLRRIWFTARDGQVMLRMARRIAPKLGINVETGYLYAGRQVVHLPGLRQVDKQALWWMTMDCGIMSASALLERVGLTPGDVPDALSRHRIPLNGPLGWDRSPALEAFFRDDQVQSAVLSAADRRRDDIRSYFRSCGLMDAESCAVVDIGWHGSVLRSLMDILGPTNASRHRFLYFGLYDTPSDLPEALMSSYCFDFRGGRALGIAHDVPSLSAVMEIFCQADHAQVMSVERRGADHVPQLRQFPSAPATLWDVGYFQSCLEAYADNVVANPAIAGCTDLRPLCAQLLRALMSKPDYQEASLLGSIQFVDDQAGTTAQPFAHSYTLSDIRHVVLYGGLPHRRLVLWEHGAWALTPRVVRLCFRVARRVRRTVNRFVSIGKRIKRLITAATTSAD